MKEQFEMTCNEKGYSLVWRAKNGYFTFSFIVTADGEISFARINNGYAHSDGHKNIFIHANEPEFAADGRNRFLLVG